MYIVRQLVKQKETSECHLGGKKIKAKQTFQAVNVYNYLHYDLYQAHGINLETSVSGG